MAREPDRITHNHHLDNGELHKAIRSHLGIGPEPVMSIEWDAYGDAATAEVCVTVSQKDRK